MLRTVWISCSAKGLSTFWRSLLIWVSTAVVPGSKFRSHTFSRIMVLLTTLLAFSISSSSKANSLFLSSIACPCRSAIRVRRSSLRSCTTSSVFSATFSGAPGKYGDPRQQLRKMKRLDHIVIAAGQQPFHFVVHIGHGSEKDHRQLTA